MGGDARRVGLISFIETKSLGTRGGGHGEKRAGHQAMTPHHLPLCQFHPQFREELGFPGHNGKGRGAIFPMKRG